MCSPEPGAGGRNGGGRGGGKNRSGNHGGGNKFGSAGGGGLSEFWSCLDPKQRDSLLTINGRCVMDTMDCELCRELLASAIRLTDEGSKADMPRTNGASGGGGGGGKAKLTKAKVKPKEKVVGLRLLDDGTYVPDFTPDFIAEQGRGFVKYSQGIFTLEQGDAVDFAVKEMSGMKAPWEENEATDRCYCHGKYLLRVVDMLTYPRPVRKFEVLLDKSTRVSVLREMMVAEVKVESVAKLVLLTKGQAIGHERNHLTLQELGFKSRQQLVVSQVLGGLTLDETGIEEKNRQFVGDLLFGGTASNDDASTPKLNKACASSTITTTTTTTAAPPPSSSGGSSPIPPSPPAPCPGSTTHEQQQLIMKPPVFSAMLPHNNGTKNSSSSNNNNNNNISSSKAKNGGKGSKLVGAGALLEIVAETGAAERMAAAERTAVAERAAGRMAAAERTAAAAGGGGEGGVVDGGAGGVELAAAPVAGGGGEVRGQQQQPPVMANHGYQVLGVTLERLARAKLAEAWREELEAQENEKKLLQELEAEVGAGEDDGASKRRSKKAKKKERDKKRREEEKRLQDEEEAKRELLRQEKIRLAEERVEEERRARLLHEREEQERQEAQWKIAQRRRLLVERDQFEMQMSLLREQGAEAVSSAKVDTTVKSQKDASASQGMSGAAGGGKEKKAKAKKQQQQQQQQQRQTTSATMQPPQRQAQSAPAASPKSGSSIQGQQQQNLAHANVLNNNKAGRGATGGGGGARPAVSGANGSVTTGPVEIATTAAAHVQTNQTRSALSPSPSSPSHPQQQQQQQLHSFPGGAIPVTAAAAAAAVSAKIVPQQAAPPPLVRHPGVAAPVQQQYAAAPHTPAAAPMGVPPGLPSRVVGPPPSPHTPPPSGAVRAGAVDVVGAPAAQQLVPVAVDGSGGMGVAGGGFCAFCGGRLVAATANFCTYCGQPVIRSPPDAGSKSLPAPNTTGLTLAGNTAAGAHQLPMSRAVGGVVPTSAASMSATAASLGHAAVHPGPVGGGRGGHHPQQQHQHCHHPQQQHQHCHHPQQQHQHQHHQAMSAQQPQPQPQQIALSASSSPSSLVHDIGALTIETSTTKSSNAAAATATADLGAPVAAGGNPAASGALPFFAQFRGSGGGGDMDSGRGITAAIAPGSAGMSRSMSDSAAPGAVRNSHVRGPQVATGPAVGGGGGGGDGGGESSSTLGGILGTGMGSLGASSGVSGEQVVGNKRTGGVGGGRRHW